MDEENTNQKTQTVLKTGITVGQKILLLLGVFGLIGFGLMVGVLVDQSVKSEPEGSYKEITFNVKTEEELRKKTAEAMLELNPKITKDEISIGVESMVQAAKQRKSGEKAWWSPKCSDCGGGSGVCLYDGFCGNARMDCNYSFPTDYSCDDWSVGIRWSYEW